MSSAGITPSDENNIDGHFVRLDILTIINKNNVSTFNLIEDVDKSLHRTFMNLRFSRTSGELIQFEEPLKRFYW